MDNQLQNSIVSFIWGIADDCLRDVYVRGKYRDVILPMTVIRRLDAMLEETKPSVLEMKKKMDEAGITNQWPALCNAAGQAFCNSSPFLLKDLTSRAKKQTLKVDFEAYLDGFSPNVQEILEKFKFRNQIDTMIDADILGAVIEKFISPTIKLSPKPVYTDDTMKKIKLPALDNHGMGTVFEELVRRFNEANNEEAGEHWTPRDVVDLMADLVVMPVADKIMDATYSCYDGACGTGGMLTVAQERLMTVAKMGGKKDILDSRFNVYLEDGTQLGMIPRTSDGQLLFLLNNVSKMKNDTPLGSRIAEVHNASSLFTGDAGSGESNARRYMIENDLVEAIIALPDNMFYNTPLGTYIWVLSNKKEERRKGKIQLIDATAMKSPLRKNMGKKNCELSSEIRKEIIRIFLEMEESEVSHVFDNDEFGFWSVTVERPLRLKVFPERKIPNSVFKKEEEALLVKKALSALPSSVDLYDWTAFSKATKLKAALLKKIRPYITEKDAAAKIVPGESDSDLKTTEIIPFKYEGGIDQFMKNEVHPYASDAWVDEKTIKTGYELSFIRYFYKPMELRSMDVIVEELKTLEIETDGMLSDILEGLSL